MIEPIPARRAAAPSRSAAPAQADNGAPAGARRPPGTPRQEIGGPQGPEPTRYGDWERGGRCVDF
jgi:hypothetical protein